MSRLTRRDKHEYGFWVRVTNFYDKWVEQKDLLYNAIAKLAYYEDLEDKVSETLQEGGTIETIVDYFLTNFTSIAGKVERACVLTNEDYDKWKRWKALDEQGKLVEVVYGFNKSDRPSAFECSVCGFVDWDIYTTDDGAYKYCSRCGAKMEE